MMGCNTLFKLDFETNEWNVFPTKGIPPHPRFGHTAIVKDRSMFVFGGYNNIQEFQDLHRFDFDTSEWNEVKVNGIPPSPRYMHNACYYDDGITKYMYIFGGLDPPKRLSDLHKFDFDTETWTELNTSGAPSVVVSGMIVYGSGFYVLGEQLNMSDFYTLYQFKFDQCKWTKLETKIFGEVTRMILNQNYLWITERHDAESLEDISLWKLPLKESILE